MVYLPRATGRVIGSICSDIPLEHLRFDRFLGLLIAFGYCVLNLPQHAAWIVYGGAIVGRGDKSILNHATVMEMRKSTRWELRYGQRAKCESALV